MRENVCSRLHAAVKISPQQVVDFRKVFQSELFGLTLKQAIGKNVENPIHVEELGATLSKDEIFKVLVLDMMEGAIAIDWREFFPYLSWIPNKSFETKIQRTYFRKNAVMNALVNQQKERIASGEEVNCFLDYLLSEGKTTLTMEQISTVLWETILESADTVLVVTEWAMYELSKDPKRQELLYQQIKSVCGSDKVSEENLSQLPYLGAIFHETLRKYSPIPLVPIRYVHEDTQLGGYHIPAATEVCINIYGCNMDKNRWEDPEEWKPERFLDQTKYDAGDLYKTMAFGAGKRACAGPLQAMLISCLTIGRVVQEFEWTLRDGARENVDTAAFTGNKLYPISAILKPRN